MPIYSIILPPVKMLIQSTTTDRKGLGCKKHLIPTGFFFYTFLTQEASEPLQAPSGCGTAFEITR